MTKVIHPTMVSGAIHSQARATRLMAWHEWKKTNAQPWKDLFDYYSEKLKKVGEV